MGRMWGSERESGTKNLLWKHLIVIQNGKSDSQREGVLICPSWVSYPLGYILIWLLLLQPEGCRRRKHTSPWEPWFWADKAMNNSIFSSQFCSSISIVNAFNSLPILSSTSIQLYLEGYIFHRF